MATTIPNGTSIEDNAALQQALHADFLSQAKKVRFRTAVMIVVVILATSIMVTSLGIYFSTKEISATVGEDQALVCGLTSNSMRVSAEVISADVSYVANLLSSVYEQQGVEGLEKQITIEAEAGPEFISLALIMPDDTIISAQKSAYPYAKPNVNLLDIYKSEAHANLVSVSSISQVASGEYLFRCYKRLSNGMIFMAYLDGNYFNEILKNYNLNIYNGGQILLVDFRGCTIASTNSDMLYHQFDLTQKAGLDGIVANSLGDIYQDLTIDTYVDRQGIEYFTATSPLNLQAQHWVVIDTLPVDSTAIPRISMIFLFSGVGILAIGVIVSIILSSFLTRPYEQLEKNQRQLAELKDQAEQASMVKSKFLSNMSHEIRTPLNAVIGMAQIAHKSPDIDRKDYCLTKIEESSNHLMGVINDILDMGKIEANKFELSKTFFDFREMVRKATDVVSFNLAAKHQTLNIDIASQIPAIIESDEQRLSQVIVNLLSNAVKFTGENGEVSLLVSQLQKDELQTELLVKVIDNGIGISENQQKKLFKAFNQADSSISRRFGGTGLGLTISKQIIELLGGTISVVSKEGEGSCFEFSFKAKYLDSSNTEQTTAASASDENNGNSFYRKRLLLVEDVEINREIVIAFLENTGIEIIEAVNGQEGVDVFSLDPGSIDIVFMDIQMPELDGYAATKAIRALGDKHAQEVPIVAMTANVFKEDIDKALAAGMSDHIAKPLMLDRVMEVLHNYLSERA